jgi:hypothetical protein
MQPGAPGPGQDPYQQYPTGYGQVPQYPDPYATGSPAAPQQPIPQQPVPQQPAQPTEYSLYPPVSGPPPEAYPQSPAYPPAGYSVPAMMPAPMAGPGRSNTVGLLSMIFGIVSLPLLTCALCSPYGAGGVIPGVVGVAAVVLGIIGVGKANRGEANNKGMSIAGVATGGSAVAIVAVIVILYVVVGVAAMSSSSY